MGFLYFLFFFVLFRATFAIVEIENLRPLQIMRDDTIMVSTEGTFELGFFTPSSSKNRYLGIWFRKIPVPTVVWVANRCKPINDSSGILTINETGNLELLGQNKSVVWSTNSSKRAREPLVQLLDNGNLIVRDEHDESTENNYLWQSFDYPTDTFLSGMKMGWDLKRGLTWKFSSWKSFDDPCNGDFTYGIEFNEQLNTYPESAMRKGSTKFCRSGPWNGQSFSGSPDMWANQLIDFGFVYNDDEVYYTYSLKNKSVISIIVVNQTANVRQRLIWIETEKIWKPYYSVPKDQCDHYGQCGANGNCITTGNPICQCLKGFKPKSPEGWNTMYWSQGCERNSPLSCHGEETDGFLKFSDLKLPDAQHTWVNKSMNLRECRAKCLSNCSCMAYTNSDIRGEGSGCVVWFGDLFDIRQFSSGGQDIYIRLSASEIAHVEKIDQDHKRSLLLLIILPIVSIIIFLATIIYYLRRLKELKLRGLAGLGYWNTNAIEAENVDSDAPNLQVFSFNKIEKATNNFSNENKLGEGGFGIVYKGLLSRGQKIAVKRLSKTSNQGVEEFENEVTLTARLQHVNLTRVLGYCIQREEKMLIYEYMPKHSLDFYIFDPIRRHQLDWEKRFHIIEGITQGLLYLQEYSNFTIIHRDLKASNVLLDNDMNPKISDFGMAKLFKKDEIEANTDRIVGTYGYVPPEYVKTGTYSMKYDVYSFGVLLLQIISGKRSSRYYGTSENLHLLDYAYQTWEVGKGVEFFDPSLDDSSSPCKLYKCLQVALLCVQESPENRPTMLEVYSMLRDEIKAIGCPKRPAFSMKSEYTSTSQQESCSGNFLPITDVIPR
ncbi:G-type lectin S-receptor-like serine/threonine-protein kinase At4g27290 [Cannabis sativa]|uniref:G-type lectin S-receptor-like serine/threonine-protein kinase At4g27290 n=1 Tax=Cannabis sativa TaxID=3483 RepID=UPI0011DFDED1|nr:G-type lectin S-receptor-like serine/threonine-protein kinase At4g27290 [Cannabis sativa]